MVFSSWGNSMALVVRRLSPFFIIASLSIMHVAVIGGSTISSDPEECMNTKEQSNFKGLELRFFLTIMAGPFLFGFVALVFLLRERRLIETGYLVKSEQEAKGRRLDLKIARYALTHGRTPTQEVLKELLEIEQREEYSLKLRWLLTGAADSNGSGVDYISFFSMRLNHEWLARIIGLRKFKLVRLNGLRPIEAIRKVELNLGSTFELEENQHTVIKALRKAWIPITVVPTQKAFVRSLNIDVSSITTESAVQEIVNKTIQKEEDLREQYLPKEHHRNDDVLRAHNLEVKKLNDRSLGKPDLRSRKEKYKPSWLRLWNVSESKELELDNQ